MGFGFALIAAFVAGAALMFIVSEHYYKRIEALLQLRKPKNYHLDPPPPIDFVDARQGEALRQGKAIRTEIRRS